MSGNGSGLGNTLGSYPASPGRRLAIGLMLLGVALILGVPGIRGIALAWSLDPWEDVPKPLLIPAALAIFAGIYAVVFLSGAWRRRGERFELYDGGFVREAGGRREVFAWEDIETAIALRETVSGLRRLLGHEFTAEVVGTDGRVVRMDGLTPHVEVLGPVIAERAAAAFRAKVPRDLDSGKIVRFGPAVAVNREALYAGGMKFPWARLPELKRDPLRLDLGQDRFVPLTPNHLDVFEELLPRLMIARPVPPGGGYEASPETPPARPEENSAGCMLILLGAMGLAGLAGALMLFLIDPLEPDFAWFAGTLVASPFICLGSWWLLRRPTWWGWLVSVGALAALVYALLFTGTFDDGMAVKLLAATPVALGLVMLLRPPVIMYYMSGRRRARR
ncbi:DUF6585 family protein [Spongiactinospora sp. TRM90649]|uniref:DUF6585 family protein n=1 Tax=Spongiactinospora sp. TRM90649 TaxID=3031114 RepID=UPI0023F70BD7|nr:DUF6585 family protein [Spongiactinospora sp. TRM90649]MDF5756982.1 hypothetical protein [Spongiactinospora sp. TRM90649]